MNNSVARGKRSCTLDVRYPEQRELFFRLVAVSDIFVENLKSTTLHQMGIHETELLQANPRMIVLRIPPAGPLGDWAHYTGFGGQFDGLTSFASLCGHRDTELIETPTTQHMDSVTGPAGVFGLLAALHYRAATGRGQVIELAQSENVLTQLGDVFINLQLGEEPQALRQPRPHRAPQGLYRCMDGTAGIDGDRRRGVAGPGRGYRSTRPGQGGAAGWGRRAAGRPRRARRSHRRLGRHGHCVRRLPCPPEGRRRRRALPRRGRLRRRSADRGTGLDTPAAESRRGNLWSPRACLPRESRWRGSEVPLPWARTTSTSSSPSSGWTTGNINA